MYPATVQKERNVLPDRVFGLPVNQQYKWITMLREYFFTTLEEYFEFQRSKELHEPSVIGVLY